MISSEFAPGNSWLQQCNHWDPEAKILKTVANKMFPSMGLGMTSVLWWNSARSCKPDFATLITKERETLAFIPIKWCVMHHWNLLRQQNIISLLYNLSGTSMIPGCLTLMEGFMLSLKCWVQLMMVRGGLPWVFFPLIMSSSATEEITPASQPVVVRRQ